VRRGLVRVHAFQILAGMLLDDRDGPSASWIALSLVRSGRAQGLSDREIVARAPAVLALIPPSVGPGGPLPAVTWGSEADAPPALAALEPREALRLRARWLDELGARAAWILGERLARDGRLADPSEVRHLTAAELQDLATGGEAPSTLAVRDGERPGPPLPATFRLSATGSVVPWVVPPRRRDRRAVGGPRGAGGGRGSGRVRHEGTPSGAPGEVLVVRVLSPALAAELDGLAGLIAETGGTLSHLAILARERNVPTVVGVRDALTRLPEGATAVVDGTTGEVSLVGVDGEEGGPPA
jgi:pyruvate,water dikinase